MGSLKSYNSINKNKAIANSLTCLSTAETLNEENFPLTPIICLCGESFPDIFDKCSSASEATFRVWGHPVLPQLQ